MDGGGGWSEARPTVPHVSAEESQGVPGGKGLQTGKGCTGLRSLADAVLDFQPRRLSLLCAVILHSYITFTVLATPGALQ